MDTLSLTGKHWVLPESTASKNASELITWLRSNRGITDQDSTLVAPAIFPDMPRAVDRIHRALHDHEAIGIFGDYDCDGVTAVAQLLRYFRRHNLEPWTRLPHRVRDGYGLKPELVPEIVAAGVTLLITADTGITAIQEVEQLKEHGIDVIITDHHQVHEQLPLAYAVIHPALCKHPLPHPSGAGVAYKLVHALEKNPWHDMNTDLALAMLGTVADLVELKGENRTLTTLGLQALERIPSGPLAQLRERCRPHDAPLTATDIAFRMAPRINAAGRMTEPDIALRALTEEGDALHMLDLLNEQRQSLTRELCSQAMREFDDEHLPPVLVSVSEDYPHGIVGLIAGKLTEHYGRPSLVAHTDGVSCTASLRSPPSYHVALGLKQCASLLDRYGGHAQAAGCTFPLNNLDTITQILSEDIASHVNVDDLVPQIQVDAVVNTAAVTLDTCRQLRYLEPYGQGNPEPVFLLPRVSLCNTKACGKDDAHLTGRIAGKKCVGFGLGNLAGRDGEHDIIARLNVSEWNGSTEAQLQIIDITMATKKGRQVAPL